MKQFILPIITFLLPVVTYAQEQLDLAGLWKQGRLSVVNRDAQLATDGGRPYLKLSEAKGEGLVWLPVEDFENGKIVIDMRGKDVLQRSFIGIAFHGVNDSTYEGVYCRPFNFFATDSIRRIHAIQYISHPEFTWKRLREERNAQFEQEIINPPDPNGWFTMTLVIEGDTVRAFINDARTPSLVVRRLGANKVGRLGLFMGDSSGGDFRSMVVLKGKDSQ
ncbi:hypothetical protein KJS94_11365 [Flavihumibacter rivuli]|uniref:hypothetical protein n=1 Tax=Flavihumibacter rivuli TaxID=2838156 RepID=UPI001BDE00A3|nr:hypothetical protein [Flavihumibacter rivuli]ULQ55241.1 hypothetical protein KJS94_11365 [Flavihumibacter rivuli]